MAVHCSFRPHQPINLFKFARRPQFIAADIRALHIFDFSYDGRGFHHDPYAILINRAVTSFRIIFVNDRWRPTLVGRFGASTNRHE